MPDVELAFILVEHPDKGIGRITFMYMPCHLGLLAYKHRQVVIMEILLVVHGQASAVVMRRSEQEYGTEFGRVTVAIHPCQSPHRHQMRCARRKFVIDVILRHNHHIQPVSVTMQFRDPFGMWHEIT